MAVSPYKNTDKRLGHLPEELEHFDPAEVNRAVSERFEAQAARSPGNLAIKSRNYSITYDALNVAANHLAHAILAKSEEGEKTITALFEHDVPSIIAFLGVLKSGKIFVPLDPTYVPERIGYSLNDSLAKILVTNTKNLELATQLAKKGQIIINIDDLSPDLSSENPGLLISADASAYLVYTSGSTGKPKGVISDHRKLNHRAHYFLPNDHLTHMFSISFLACIDDILGALMNGLTLFPYDLKEEGIGGLADWLISEEITVFRPPSSILRQFNDALDRTVKFSEIRKIHLGGQAVYTEEVKRLLKRCSPDCVAKVYLASTEAGRISQYFFDSKTVIESDIVPVGYPTIGMEIKILDNDGKELDRNQVGEIVLKSSYLAKEYWRDPELTKEKFIPDPKGGDARTYFTGDLGRMREDDLLEHLGRKDFQVKIRGYRVEISAIEAHLQNLGSVKEVVVVPQAYERTKEKYLTAYIVPARQPAPTVRSLRDSMTDKFAKFMIPARFVMLEKLPRTSSNKLDRRALPVPTPDRPDLGNSFIAPNEGLEKKLAEVWEDIIGVKPIGASDNFFDLGGDSLMAAQLFVDIEKVFGMKLPLSILYKASNIREQAHILQREDVSDEWSAMVNVQPEGSNPPLFCFPGKGGNPIRFRQLSQRLGKNQPVYMLQSRGLSGAVDPYVHMEDITSEFKNAIQDVQPNGPYYLIGSSGGGKVAYEIAQQLLSEGETVDVLAFVDTYGPGYPNRLPYTTRLVQRVYRVVQFFGKHIANLRVASWEGRKSYLSHYIKESWQRVNGFPSLLVAKMNDRRGPKLPPELIAVEKANLIAAKRYQPQPYPGRVILFRAEQQPWGIHPDPTLGWGDIGIKDLVIHEVPGHHGSILFEPRVGKLAGILKGLLE